MKTSISLPALLRKRGVALILVVSVLALLTILMLAMFSATDNEFKSTQGYVASQDARRLGDIAVNIVTSQLQVASVPTPNSVGIGSRYITATQPGEVRRYNLDGSFNAAFKLYSSPQMQVYGTSSTDEANLVSADVPPVDWDTRPEIYVDLNEPIIRSSVADSSLTAELYFPIVDPRGYRDSNPQGITTSPAMVNVEGFSYTKKAPITLSATADGTSASVTGGDIHGIVLPTGASSGFNAQRLPMPVTWLYVLQDGSLGTLDATTKNYIKAPGSSDPSADNPIVGRVGLWTDDETNKININTAAEGTFWATPRFFHDRERTYAEKPPTAMEYQRFPGHPATVALSSVFFPDINGVNSFDFYNQSLASPAVTTNMERIRRIYDIVPKIARGGSDFGTYVYATDDTSSTKAALPVSMKDSSTEHLYASLDELLFSHQMSNNNRVLNDKWVPDDVLSSGVNPTPIVDPTVYGRDTRQTIEQSRFFLTANSRAPEFNIYGMPRVCMWPISYYNDSTHRTIYDKLIAFCSTLKSVGDNSYYFQRAKAHDSTYDINLDRNSRLMNYLATLTTYQMPATSNVGVGASSAASLRDKYNKDNMNTVLVEIFDYIRSTNLYDDLLSNKNAQTTTTGKSETQTYTDAPAEFYTYTNPLRYNNRTTDNGGNPVTPRIVADDGWPGHGTVSPSIWSVGSTKYRGMGRFITISEIGIHFICTADGGNGAGKEVDDGQYGPINGVYSGGRSVERIDPNISDIYRNEGASVAYSYFKRVPQTGDKARWWSNYPPKPLKDQYGTKVAKYLQQNASDNPNNHPGYDPMNWNCTLDPSIPLSANQKRIQALVDVEFFCPSEGWTLLNPEWTIVLGTPGQDNPISGIKVNNIPLWSTANKVYVIKSNKNIFSVSSSVGRSGGSVSPTAIYNGRKVGGNQNLPKDVGYDDSGNATASGHLGLDNCDLASGFATITAPSNNQTMTIQFTNPNGLPIALYDTHNWQSAQPVQTFTVNLAQGGSTITAPVPQLITQSTNKRTYTSGGVRHIQRAVDAPHFWCFQYSGCLGRYQSSGIITPLNVNGGAYATAVPEANISTRLAGRFRLENDATTIQAQGGEFNAITGNANVALPASNALIYTMSTPGLYDSKSGKTYEQLFGSDVVRSVTPCGGDYRIVASLYNVPANVWQPHRNWNARFTNAGGQQSWYYNCHNFCSRNTDDAGFDTNLNTSSIPNAPQFVRAYPANSFANMGAKMPDVPQADMGGSTTSALDALNSFLDFDNDQGDGRDGAFCNKPDEGNFSALNYQFSVGEKTYRNGYFYTSYEMEPDKTITNAYFTPNRLISSPVMFGSLVTTTFDAPTQYQAHGYTGAGRPWQTLLFRPHVTPTSAGSSAAQFAGSIIPVAGASYLANHPGAQNPPDHYLLDLFTMPVVEPYAISEPLSTAGKINLNYQIVPFTYIRRATAVYAAMKGELMRAISISDNGNRSNPLTTAYTYKNQVTAASGQTLPVFPPMYFWSETGSSVSAQQPAVNNHYWHRRIDPAETTKQLDERFLINTALPDRRRGLLRSASQVCELHMIPANPPTVPTGMYIMPGPSNVATRETNMQKFWSVHALTGDNTREEIYSHLYPKFTTRSNTFRVHVRAQALKKSRSTAPGTFSTADGDKVLSEYRGSYLLERYIDPNDSTTLLPNYGGGGDPMNAPSLENYYRFHILEVKRFAP